MNFNCQGPSVLHARDLGAEAAVSQAGLVSPVCTWLGGPRQFHGYTERCANARLRRRAEVSEASTPTQRPRRSTPLLVLVCRMPIAHSLFYRIAIPHPSPPFTLTIKDVREGRIVRKD